VIIVSHSHHSHTVTLITVTFITLSQSQSDSSQSQSNLIKYCFKTTLPLSHQVAGVKVNLLMREFMLLGLELEELLAVHDGSNLQQNCRCRQRKERFHTLSIHLCSRIEPGFTLCFGTKAFGRLHSGSNEWHGVGTLGTQTPCLRRDQILHLKY
jgi:hypothetical protein